MYSPPCASGNNGEQCFAGGATPLVSLDQAMDFSEPIVFPMHDVGMQEGVQFCNATGDHQPSRNVSIDKCSKGSKRKVAGEGSSSMHSQEETDVMSQREVGAERGNENTSDGDTNREDYVHVRAKRGQATNSHSLAERFRREKINERMKLLQDLVPGCNKITGKAMMLDEIINYVQSLQRQVEFLSMKLSAISPELNCDLDHLPLKDILCSQDACSAFLGSSSRLNNVHPNLYRVSQQGFSRRDPFSSFPNPADAHMARTHQFAALPQRAVLWDDELRSIAPVAFMNSDAATSSLENSDAMKVE